jgi:2-haloacid dehalogenase
MADRWATFDCYGTLVDWMSGIRSTLARLFPDADPDELLARYHEVEPRIQAGRGIAYRVVMAEALAEVARIERMTVPMREAQALADSLPSWPIFPEVPPVLRELRASSWKLAILSNTDGDLLAASLETIGVAVDVRIVAGDIGSYKPALEHWEAFFRQTGADRSRHVHVGASLFHDVEPCAALGLPCVWINRLAETSTVPRASTLENLTHLPSTLDELVPA